MEAQVPSLKADLAAALEKIKSGQASSTKCGCAMEKDFPDLLQRLYAATSFLDDAYSHVQLRSRIACALNGIDRIGTCSAEGCSKPVNMSRLRPDQPIPRFCCAACAQRSPDTSNKKRETKLRRYGDPVYCNKEQARRTVQARAASDSEYFARRDARVRQTKFERHGSETYVNVEKARQTKLTRYGDANFSNRDKARSTMAARSDEDRRLSAERRKATIGRLDRENPGYKARAAEKSLRTRQERYGVGNATNHSKCARTMEERYGVSNAFELDSVKAKIRDGNLERYGVEHYSSTSECRSKVRSTCMGRYGVGNVFQSPDVREAIRLGNLERYGVEHNWQREDVKASIRATNLERYGNESPMRNPDVRKSAAAKYVMYLAGSERLTPSEYLHRGRPPAVVVRFDSAPELAMYVWLADSFRDFEYQPRLGLEYEFGGRTHVYFPDFKIDGELYELKGDQFFVADGRMVNPFDHSQDGLYEAKHQCMLANGVKILREADYSKYLEYVEKTYGKNFLKSFRNTKSGRVNKFC